MWTQKKAYRRPCRVGVPLVGTRLLDPRSSQNQATTKVAPTRGFGVYRVRELLFFPDGVDAGEVPVRFFI